MDSPAGALAAFSASARSFAAIHSGQCLEPFADNLSAEVTLLDTGTLAMPATITLGDQRNAWVCSARTAYADYAGVEAARYFGPTLARPLQWLCAGVGRWLDGAGIDRAVTINNWALATNLYPPLDAAALEDLVAQARARWPSHAVWFRSLNAEVDRDWIHALSRLGFRMLASRQVYLFDDLPALHERHANLKRDLAQLRRTTLKRAGNADIGEDDYARIADLYSQLYLQKHSRLNPAYSGQFMRRWHQAGLLEFDGLRGDDGRLLSVIGLFRQGATLTVPVTGYDTALPKSLGLYRLAMACAFEATMRHGCQLNLSAGAAHFKRLRGGQPAIEYSAVLAAHRPGRTRHAVAALSWLTRRVGVPLMRRYRL